MTRDRGVATSLRTRLALASTSGYLTLLLAQLCLPFFAGIVVRIPFDTPYVRSTVCEEQHDKPVVYVSDPHGFRNATDGAGAIEWAAIGDSFTQGACVESGRGFVDLIARRYGKALNLGMSGDGPLLELAALKEYLPAAKPRTVVWFFYPGNDLGDLQLEKTNAILARYLEVAALRRYAFPTPGKYDFDLFRRVMEEARRSVEAWGGRLVFVYLPDHVPVPDLPAPARADRDRTLGIVRDLRIPIVDVEASVQSVERSELFYNSTSHYSEQGNALVADVTVRGLLDSQ